MPLRFEQFGERGRGRETIWTAVEGGAENGVGEEVEGRWGVVCGRERGGRVCLQEGLEGVGAFHWGFQGGRRGAVVEIGGCWC
jgi:hypothetical protein